MKIQSVEILKGMPTIVAPENEWLGEGQKVHFSKEDDGLGIDFKVEGLLSQEGTEGAEFLAAMAVNDPSKIRFGLKLGDDDIGVYLCVLDQRIVLLGCLPKFLEVVLRKNWNQFISAKILTARQFQVGISAVGEEVGRGALLEGAELLEDMAEVEFNKLMGRLGDTLGQQVYVVKIGLFISRDLANGNPLLEG